MGLTPSRSGLAARIAVKEVVGFRFASQGGLEQSVPAGLLSRSGNFVYSFLSVFGVGQCLTVNPTAHILFW